ncbi:MAG: universal stress protein [Acidobacteria bacterium]|nr:universal stress protein [Acidobacteriota bacterium]
MTDRMKILVAYDGSECADAALDDLCRAGLPDNAQIKVLSVVESWLPSPSGLEIAEHIDKDQEYLALAQRGAARLLSTERGWDVKTESGAGSPATVIIEKAEEWGADLIVVGSHGRTALGRILFGSVSQKLLHEAHCSVRVARSRIEEPDKPFRLIIGVDGSEGSEEAIAVVVTRKWPEGSEVRVINARFSIPHFDSHQTKGPIIEWLTHENIRLKKVVDATVARLSAAGLRADAVVKDEEPKRLLLGEAESWGADCIFVGARGMGKLERFLIGSVSSAVAARAHCSVEVVRRNDFSDPDPK